MKSNTLSKIYVFFILAFLSEVKCRYNWPHKSKNYEIDDYLYSSAGPIQIARITITNPDSYHLFSFLKYEQNATITFHSIYIIIYIYIYIS